MALSSTTKPVEEVKSADLEKQYHMQVYPRNPIEFTHGKGSFLFDVSGNSYLDFLSGIAVNSLGHAHQGILAAINTQASQYIHLSNLVQMPAQSKLAATLAKACSQDRVFFCNSGTEANEALLKFVRKYWALKGQADRIEIITFENSFHGRTCGALALTGQSRLQENFGPLVPGVTVLKLNDIEGLRAACSNKTAAILMEPILAEGGILTPSADFVNALHAMKEQHEIILCADEIQTGGGRLGTFLGSTSIGYQPDIVSMAKPIGGGLPLGAVLLGQQYADAIVPGDHGTTFGGNPVSCAAGQVVVDTVLSEGFLDNVQEKSKLIQHGLKKLSDKYEFLGNIRGQGLLLGLETTLNPADVISACQAKGLIIARAGANVLRFLPPLNVEVSEVEQFLETLDTVFQEIN